MKNSDTPQAAPQSKDFEGLVAAVTGGSKRDRGGRRRSVGRPRASVVVLDIAPGVTNHVSIHCDITSESDVAAAIARISGEHGGLDILINNAGISAAGNVAANDRDEWNRVLDINVVPMARVSALTLPLLRASKVPSIVNVSSVIAVVGVRNRALYSASKGAIFSLTLTMAADHVAEGIRVNAVAPGTADTPWVKRLLAAADDPVAEAAALSARQPIGRLVTADEVAHAIAYLASPLSSSTTGTILGVDGEMATLRV